LHLCVKTAFFAGGPSGGNDADNIVLLAITVNDNQDTKAVTEAEENEAIFIFRVVRIIDKASSIVGKDGLGFFKGHAVLSKVLRCLLGIPFDT
jgi:hypothetical protein